jgi:colicin import membrane protein
MTFRTIPRAAVTGSLTAIRLPADGILRYAGDSRGVASFRIALDRADASVRRVAANVLGDQQLREDAAALTVAADERAEALRLRARAEEVEERADAKVSERESEADRRRAEATEEAKRKRQAADERRDAAKERAAKQAESRREAARKEAAEVANVIAERDERARLEQLDAKAEAVEEKSEALEAADDAQRLREATAAVKAERKDA